MRLARVGPLEGAVCAGAATRFTDSVRSRWHESDGSQAAFEEKIARVEKLKAALAKGEDLATLAVRYTFSHPAVAVTIPGATRPEQAAANAAAGERELTADEKQRLVAALE